MYCRFFPCTRRVGLRRYCPPHRLLVTYYRVKDHERCGPGCRLRPRAERILARRMKAGTS